MDRRRRRLGEPWTEEEGGQESHGQFFCPWLSWPPSSSVHGSPSGQENCGQGKEGNGGGTIQKVRRGLRKEVIRRHKRGMRTARI